MTDSLGVVRYRLDRLPVYERRFTRAIRLNAAYLVVLGVLVVGVVMLVPALGMGIGWLAAILLLLAVVPTYTVASLVRFRAGLPKPGGPDVALVVRRSGLDVAWPDIGPSRLVTLVWGDLVHLGKRGPMRGVMVLRLRARRRPAGSWWRVAYIPQDMLDTPIDLIVDDAHALAGGFLRF